MEIGDGSRSSCGTSKTGTSAKPLSELICKIDDLPELLLVEILCRLPSNKLVFQCKCVSKRWCELISSPHFVRHFLNLQRQLQKPILGTLVFGDGGMFVPWMETPNINRVVEEEENLSPLPSLNLRLPFISEHESLFVKGACNDLLLCCTSRTNQRDYYICNPYTKQWVALPPPPRVHDWVGGIGFICDPYYTYSSSSARRTNVPGGDHCSIYDTYGKPGTDNIRINVEYRCRVVRILKNFHVDIFFSETGEWRESVNAVFSRPYNDVNTAGIAHNGKLYWCGSDDYTAYAFELDPFATNTTADGDVFIDKCRLTLWPIEPPVPSAYLIYMHLSACQGSLRACKRIIGDYFSVWELENEPDVFLEGGTDNLKWRSLLDDVSLYQMDANSKQSLLACSPQSAKIVLGFHPVKEDIMYLTDDGNIIMCNLRARTLELVPARKISRWANFELYPFALPWWPTPLPIF